MKSFLQTLPPRIRRFVPALLLSFACLPVRGQLPPEPLAYPDSLERVLLRNVPDTVRIRTLYLLSHYWSDRDTTRALEYVRRGMKISKSHPFLYATGYFYLAGCYFDTDVEKSQRYYMVADSLLERYDRPEAYNIRSRAWHNYGALQQRRNDEKSFANIILSKSIPLAEKSQDTLRVARNYLSLGLIFSNQVDYPKAISYFKIAEEIMTGKGAAEYELLELYLTMCRNYVYLKEHANAFAYLTKARAMLGNDPASPFLPEYYLIEGMYRAGLGEHNQALASFDTGIETAPKVHREMDVPGLLFEKFKSLKSLKRYPEAAGILEAQIRNDTIRSKISRDLLLHLYHMSEIQALMGRHKQAYDWLLRFTVAADSIKVENMSTEIAGLEARYRSAEKEKQILQLQTQNEKAALTIRNNRLLNWLFGSVSLFLLIVSALAILFYRNSKKLLQHREHVHELELHRIKQDQRILMLSSMLEGQEQERTRLARDLHDGLGGLLSGIKIELSQVDLDTPRLGKQNLSRTIGHLDDAVNELRRIARSLMPELLMKYGLAEATREFCKSLNMINKTAVVCQVFNYRENLPKEKQIVLYRIIQELVNNALKHAGASQVLVILQQREDTLFVTVEDDGKGFDVAAAEAGGNGSGMANLKARTEFLNGSIDIQSSPETGTAITIECPV